MKKMVIIVVIASIALLAIMMAVMPNNVDKIQREGMPIHASIFENIQELEQALTPYRIDQASDDPALDKLDYTSALQWIVEKDGHRFTVYGYTFTDLETAWRYRTDLGDCITTYTNVLRSTTEYLARYQKNVLYIKGKGYDDTEHFVNWLEAYLPIKEEEILYDLFDDVRALYQTGDATE